MSNILLYLFIFLYFYLLDQAFIYHVQKRFCKKYNGICKNCDCWSCCRKIYIDEYKNNLGG